MLLIDEAVTLVVDLRVLLFFELRNHLLAEDLQFLLLLPLAKVTHVIQDVKGRARRPLVQQHRHHSFQGRLYLRLKIQNLFVFLWRVLTMQEHLLLHRNVNLAARRQLITPEVPARNIDLLICGQVVLLSAEWVNLLDSITGGAQVHVQDLLVELARVLILGDLHL